MLYFFFCPHFVTGRCIRSGTCTGTVMRARITRIILYPATISVLFLSLSLSLSLFSPNHLSFDPFCACLYIVLYGRCAHAVALKSQLPMTVPRYYIFIRIFRFFFSFFSRNSSTLLHRIIISCTQRLFLTYLCTIRFYRTPAVRNTHTQTLSRTCTCYQRTSCCTRS
jgi:hypothetical protein